MNNSPNDSFLILNFHIQFLINFIDENNLLKHANVKQRFKNALKNFQEALEDQANYYVYCTAINPLPKMDYDCLHNLHQGTLAIEEYFNLSFAIAELKPERKEEFTREYEELLKKFNLDKIS